MTPIAKILDLTVRGFRSIRALEDFEARPINILIGPNGAGKSNFIALFRLLQSIVEGNLQHYVAQQGGASVLLFDGPARTRQLGLQVEFYLGSERWRYELLLEFAAGDSFVIDAEHCVNDAGERSLDSGVRESKIQISECRELGGVVKFLREIAPYQFHNTSETSRFRLRWLTDDNDTLKADGGNLAPFLLRMREAASLHYRKVVDLCRQVLPFFDDFVLKPEGNYILLRWKERGSDLVLNASVASDGMLRVFALIALLCQPEDWFPSVLVLDEPELGLHPSAIEIVAGLIRSASTHTQIFAATQSTALLNEFEPEDIVVVERQGRESTFRRLRREDLAGWLEEYSLADLWWKNVLGGKP